MVARNVVDRSIHFCGIDVERDRDPQLQALPVEIFGDGLPQVTHTDYGDVHRAFAVEDVADKIDQHLYVVAFLGIAREPDQHQIPTHLHSRNAVNPGQHVRKNVGNALPMAGEQRTAILAEPLDRFFGNSVGY